MITRQSCSRFTGNCFLLFVSLVVGLLLLEIILRVFTPFEMRLKGDRIILPVNQRYEFHNSGLRGVDDLIVHSKNSVGFRGEEPAMAEKGALRIVAIGGSTTECLFLSDGHDWPALVGANLRAEGEKVWINNAGLDGHSTFGHALLFDEFVAPLKPDFTLYLVGLNDLSRLVDSEHTAAQIRSGLIFTSVEGFFKSVAAYSDLAALALHLYRVLKAQLNGLPHKAVDLTTVPQGQARERGVETYLAMHRTKYLPGYEARLRDLVARTRKAGSEPALITQPALYGPGHDPVTGVDLSSAIIGRRSGLTIWRRLEIYNDVTRKVAAELNTPLIDLARKMPKDSTFFYDWNHYTNAGAAQVARIVTDGLKPLIAEKKRGEAPK